jgi:cobalt-zinc-cadmium efflux system membrane fusion protein
MNKSFSVVLTSGLAAFLLTGCSHHAEPQTDAATPSVTASNVTLTADQQQHIQFATVASSEFHKIVDTTGTVNFDSDRSTAILAPMGGPVSRLLVKLGEVVTNGQPLAEVDSPDFAAAITTYQKALATAKIMRQLADQDQDLVQHHGVSLREADQAKIDATNAAADAQAAFLQLVSLKVDSNTLASLEAGKATKTVPAIIRSPIAGTVVDRSITPGELLSAGSTQCFTVADLSRVWVMANLFGADVSSVNVGDTAEVLTGIGTNTIPGTVENISAEIDPDTRSVSVRVVAQNPDGALKNQMYVRVLIRSKEAYSGLLAPVSAVLRDEENLPFVYVAQSDGSFARQGITLGYRDGDKYAIPTGLKTGDKIVTDGALFVQFLQNQ